MLFDLRSPGRKRAVQALYVVLALVLVGGTVLFGVGTGLPGIFGGGNNTAQNVDLEEQQQKRLDQVEAQVRRNPQDAKALATLASLRYAAGVAKYGENDVKMPAAAKPQFEAAATAWEKYLALDPQPIDQSVANRMVTVFQTDALNRPADWADTQAAITQQEEAEAEKNGTKVGPAVYLSLLQAQYAAKRDRQAKITVEKLRAVTPKAQKDAVEDAIKAAKDPSSAAAAGGTGSDSGGGTITLPEDEK
ncbi:hypothetical protein [Patulibacter sp. SYSU D01012]|uniref:hypothetical protein n=1 Tax=Patulibacter sp. SYSU D01012 TaxID=2817381 RepID=UPI001B3136C3|nr:hypothetical protein [Patulibacter sp. SYSU D01012]